MARIRTLFLLLIIIGPLHMGEQLLTGIEEFYSIRQIFGGYYAWSDPSAADHASVVLITIGWTFCSLFFYALLQDGISRLIVPAVMGLFGALEIHHLVETFQKGAYDPGVITCVPYAIVGNLLIAAVLKELRRQRAKGAVTQTGIITQAIPQREGASS
jgi:hypothetical protein